MRGHLPGATLVLLASMAGCSADAVDMAPVSDAAERFLVEQRDGAWTAAYARLHRSMQQRCGSARQLGEEFASRAEPPVQWTLLKPMVRRYTAEVQGELGHHDGTRSAMTLAFDRAGDEWLVTAWSIGQRELCP